MDERESLGKSLFSDFVASGDLEEAVGTAQELEAPGFMPKLVQVRRVLLLFYLLAGWLAVGGWAGWAGCLAGCGWLGWGLGWVLAVAGASREQQEWGQGPAHCASCPAALPF